MVKTTPNIVKEMISALLSDGIPVSNFFEKQLAYYQYQGSLTTPPLLPDVTWVVLAQPTTINPSDYQIIHQDYPNNHRQLQDLKQRTITYYAH